MKMKKLLTTLGCFALILVCAFTFVGCGEVDSSIDEVNAFLANDSVQTSFDRGISLEMTMSGYGAGENYSVKISGQIDKDGKGQLRIYSNTEGEKIDTRAYIDGEYIYFEKYLGNNKVKYALSDAQDEDVGSILTQIYSQIDNGVEYFLSNVGTYSGVEGFKIQKKGDEAKGNVEYIASVSHEKSFIKSTIKFSDYKIVEMINDMNMTIGGFLMTASANASMTMRIYQKFSIFTGKVTLPNNLNTYTLVA